jgi:hypothetical protein
VSNDWQKRFGAARRAIDRRILAEAELAIERAGAPDSAEAMRAKCEAIARSMYHQHHLDRVNAARSSSDDYACHLWSEQTASRIANAIAALKGKPWPDTAPVHHISEEQRLAIARAFGRPVK